MSRPLPHVRILRALLDYDQQTGALTWRLRERYWFPTQRAFSSWNSRYAGKPAFTALRHGGYPHGDILGQQFAAHRVIWKWMTGYDPEIIDHINGDPRNNKWGNLRSGSNQDNQRNIRRSKANTSGVTGVGKCNRGPRPWQAYIRAGGKRVSLGTFFTLEEAVAARREAERQHGYHPNHGRAEPVTNPRVVVSIG